MSSFAVGDLGRSLGSAWPKRVCLEVVTSRCCKGGVVPVLTRVSKTANFVSRINRERRNTTLARLQTAGAFFSLSLKQRSVRASRDLLVLRKNGAHEKNELVCRPTVGRKRQTRRVRASSTQRAKRGFPPGGARTGRNVGGRRMPVASSTHDVHQRR